ncbi:MucB/RseB C-terminal domain-containing protein [Stutzerimonas xanthomarina]|uniref:Sigma E regulatory protein, MucB/RseB n=2 Tax=Stutzerimonas xanthomarina TaxID=271420 RepID=A0A1M5PU44_9GAMM|nr:MucB/RseB C-terminal domain-containing protein [Stutzerimonas xanthomarina]MCP9338295.1 MucB/RseB C-terminal domain-containing protein [Stutzerimonas xanthomarina]SEH71507.1 sigma E regulatory protein, MucB/RseB [Stutzerimonas xanthomarina]SHH05096.1 sigma E regulatory protein, MucB/RseB [Stutzerimonas xanthomarina DSM 18231]
MRVIPLFVVLGGWLSMPAFAAEADVLMQRLAAAEKKQSYQGTFVYERNGSFSSHAVWQLADEQQLRERLLQLDGPAAEVVLLNGKIQCATEDMASQVREITPWRQQLEPDVLSKWYDFQVIGESRVAGRPTVALAIRPRDQHRYGFELHLDRETYLPLKSLLLDESGQLLERFQFTHFAPGSAAPSDLKGGADCKPVSLAAEQKEATSTKWRSDWLPDGFQLIDSDVRSSPASKESVTWLSYGDGIARVSVFIEPLGGAVVEDARSQMGPTVAVSKRISTADGDVMVTVVGEVPLGTAERIALSMRSGAGQATQ